MSVNIPLTGAGGTTATVATEQIGGAEFQFVKLTGGATGSSAPVVAQATTPGSGDNGLVVRPIASTAFQQAVVNAAGSSANTIGSVALVAGSSANNLGQVTQGPGSSANYWYMQTVPFSSGSVARTSVSTTVDTQLIAANASRKALIIANRSTSQTVGIGFSTAAVTTALANVDLFLQPASYVQFGPPSGLPLYQGPLRGINLTSTTVAGSVGVTEFT